MTNHGDDCYFFYYSTCTKGDSCPFRHCEAAMGSETVCNLWQEGRCFRMVCKFRHMEIKKNRREIACYWENQPAGCQKSHCAFHHEKSRFIDGLFIPADKGSAPKEVVEPQEDPAPPPPAPAPLATAANPQLRGVIKAETQENVPSPTHPPVVINPADDDEDEDDQFSEEEASPRKLAMGSISDDSLNFGIRTLEEIRLRKALKASMKRYGRPLGEDPDDLTGQRTNGVREKENIRSNTGHVLFPATDDILSEEPGRRNVAERLGNRIIMKDVPAGIGDLQPPKRRLAERLGRIVDEEESGPPPQKALKPIRDRLGMPAEPAVATESVEPPVQPEKAPAEVRIKTLEEIRLAKAAKNQNQKTAVPVATTRTSPKGSKRTVTVKPSSVAQVKTFSEFNHAKRKLGEEEQQQQPQQQQRLKKTKQQPAAEAPGDLQGPANAGAPGKAPPPGAEVRVKTLEEIRREKAARARASRGQVAGNGEGPDKAPAPSGEEGAKKPRLLRLNKPTSPGANGQKTAEQPGKLVEPSAAATEPRSDDSGGRGMATNGGGGVASNGGVKVKTFEEIMREKRLRRQQLEEQAGSASQSDSSVEAEPAQKRASPTGPAQKRASPTGPALQRKIPVRAREVAGSSSPPSSSPSLTPEAPPKAAPVRKRIGLKTKASAAAGGTPSPQRGSPPRQAESDSPSLSPRSSSVSPGKRKRVSPAAGPSKQARGAASPRPSTEEAVVSQAQDGVQRKSPGQATEAKVRPKLNVKPSVVKPAAQVKPGQKRKAAESAVAAVKPLNSAAAREELPSPRKRASPPPTTSSVEAQLSPAAPRTPVTLLGPGPGSASPSRVELQMSPVTKHGPGTTSVPTTTTQSCVPPESSVTKTPSRPRRLSVPAPSAATSAVDDFEELLNEFTGDGDDSLEDEMELDHDKGEDDLLLELSEMIDS